MGKVDFVEVKSFGKVPSENQVKYQREELTAFIHFGINTFTGMEWGDGGENPNIFNPTELDAKQWVSVLSEAGFKRIILTCKHHDGFCLWNSKYTKHSVVNSPWKDGKGDVVKEFSDACHKYGVKIGFYLSPWDQNSEYYGTGDRYNQYYINQLEELLTNYGEVSEIWMDGAKGSNVKQDYKFNEWFEFIKKLQPNCLIFSPIGPDIRWIGNEKGYAGKRCFSTISISKMKKGEDIEYLNKGEIRGEDWLVGECDVSIRPGWFYHENQDNDVKSLEKLLDIYYKSVGRNGVLLLNVPPNKKGRFHENDVNRIKEFGKALKDTFSENLALNKRVKVSSSFSEEKYNKENIVDGNYDTYWVGNSCENEIVEIDFEKEVEFDVIMIQEYIPLGQRILEFDVEVLKTGLWELVFSGESIGYKRCLKVLKNKSKKIRITIKKSLDIPVINNIGVYKEPYYIEEKKVIKNKGSENISFLEFEKDSYVLNRHEKKAFFKVLRRGNIENEVEINYETLQGTALSGVDFQTWSGTLKFNKKEIEKTFEINIIKTNTSEEREFYLKLSDCIGGEVGRKAKVSVLIR